MTPMKKEPLKIMVKNVKHVFTPTEIAELHVRFGGSYDSLLTADADLKSVTTQYEAKVVEAETRMTSLRSTINAGFENRDEKCVVILDLKAGKKHFHLESVLVEGKLPKDAVPILTEAITDADRQTEMLEVESKFEAKEDIELFKPVGTDNGYLTVGRLNGKWFAGLHVKIGTRIIGERLDSEQPCTKKRADCVKKACKRFGEWLDANLGHEEAKGFHNDLALVVAGHAEREE